MCDRSDASVPCTRKATPAALRQKKAVGEGELRLSDSQASEIATANAMAKGGIVNSCAARPSYPNPDTIVGVNNEILDTGTDIARNVK